MKIDYLGHSEFLVNITNKAGENVRILCDSWLSHYSVGDLMGRNPSFELDYEKIGDIDAIFLSHAHMDHIDPYTLVSLFKNLKKKPKILLPETVIILKPLLEKYLNNPEIIVLSSKQTIEIRGIKITGYIFETNFITNEDDVAGLFIANEKEILFTEVDLVPPDTDEVQQYMYKKFGEQNYENRIYLATRNELEGNLKMLDITDPSERKNFEKEYIALRREEIEYDYYKFQEEYVEFRDIFSFPNMGKIFIGQGISYPKNINPEFLKLQIFPLSQVLALEKEYAKETKSRINLDMMTPGKSFTLQNGKIIQSHTIDYLKNFEYLTPAKDLQTNITRTYASCPLRNEKRDETNQENMILSLLNHKFLPYWFCNSENSLKNAMLKNQNKAYTIAIKYGTKENFSMVYYRFDFSKSTFEKTDSKDSFYDESYWANDLEDFRNGTQELYSNFLHALEPNKTYRLWTLLGANFINNDILFNKFEYHFQQANEGKTANEFVEKLYENI